MFSYYTDKDYKHAFMYTKLRRGLLEFRVLDEFDYVRWLNDGTIQKDPRIVYQMGSKAND